MVFLGSQVEDTNANIICAQLSYLAALDPTKDISIYINSPGGSVTAGMAIYDTMQLIPRDVATVGMGFVASMGQFPLTAGTKGKRSVLPHAKILMHQPLADIGGSAIGIQIQAAAFTSTKREMAEIIAAHTGQTFEKIVADSDRDNWFSAEEALEYGFVDRIVSPDVDARPTQ